MPMGRQDQMIGQIYCGPRQEMGDFAGETDVARAGAVIAGRVAVGQHDLVKAAVGEQGAPIQRCQPTLAGMMILDAVPGNQAVESVKACEQDHFRAQAHRRAQQVGDQGRFARTCGKTPDGIAGWQGLAVIGGCHALLC